MQQTIDPKAKQDQTIAGSVTFVINAILIVLLYLINAHTTVIPPPQLYGVEVNFGTSDIGSGKIQTHNKPNDLDREVESKPATEANTKPVPAPPTKEIKKTEVVKQPKVETAKEAPVKVSKVESPVKVAEKPEVKKIEPVKPTPAPAKVPEAKPSPPEPVRTADPKALYKKGGGTGQSNGTIGNDPNPGGNNNGNDAKGVGDKGSPDGKINNSAIYKGPSGNGGTGAGASLNLAGWTWKSKPVVNDNSSETGRIVFQITIDDEGKIISIITKESTVSPSVLDLYKRAVARLDFDTVSNSGNRAERSTGTIVFNIKSK
jgi:hypothetical protein